MTEPIPITTSVQRRTFPDEQIRTAADAIENADRTRLRSLYIHVPFCFHKCHYCDFYSIVDREDSHRNFVDALCVELRALGRSVDAPALETIFVGGGTPTLLSPAHWLQIAGAIHDNFDLSPIGAGAGEWTVECNPETATPELAHTLAALGVTRVSVGAQSFNPRHLKALERWHDPESVARALGFFHDAGVARRSVDLIFAIPGQTLDELDDDLRQALAADPGLEHVSCYCLTYEPNTPMTVRLHRDEFEPASETLEVTMLNHIIAMLGDAGLARYEVSNFAKPGAQCQHNLRYWRQCSWLAAGPAASGHAIALDNSLAPALASVGVGARWKNIPHLGRWLKGVHDNAGWAPVIDVEPPDAARALRERIMTGLRLAEGVDATMLLAAADALGCAAQLEAAGSRAVDAGLLTSTLNKTTGILHWKPTDTGFRVADALAADMMACVDAP